GYPTASAGWISVLTKCRATGARRFAASKKGRARLVGCSAASANRPAAAADCSVASKAGRAAVDGLPADRAKLPTAVADGVAGSSATALGNAVLHIPRFTESACSYLPSECPCGVLAHLHAQIPL